VRYETFNANWYNQFEIQNQLRRLYNLIKKVPHIPSLRLDDFNQAELLNYLYPIQEQAKKVSFGVGIT